MTQPSHAPTPWMLAKQSYGYDIAICKNGQFAGWFIELHHGARHYDTEEFLQEFEASVAFIVKAVNAHDAMVNALEFVANSGHFECFDDAGWDLVNAALDMAGAK